MAPPADPAATVPGSGRVSGRTRVVCLLGNPVAYNVAPRVHNAVYRARGDDIVYVPFAVDDIARALDGVRALGIGAAAVARPFKVAVVAHVDECDPAVTAIGSANTVLNRDGHLTAYNTDWSGAMRALEEVVDPGGRTVALVGAGGTRLRAIAYGLMLRNAFVHVFNRTVAHGDALAVAFGLAGSHDLGDSRLIRDADIVINTTPVGQDTDSDRSPLPSDCLTGDQTVFDVVSVPPVTRLLAEAREKGAAIVRGDAMLVHAVADQLALFTGVAPPVALVRSCYEGT